jgi:hypothetical protein
LDCLDRALFAAGQRAVVERVVPAPARAVGAREIEIARVGRSCGRGRPCRRGRTSLRGRLRRRGVWSRGRTLQGSGRPTAGISRWLRAPIWVS